MFSGAACIAPPSSVLPTGDHFAGRTMKTRRIGATDLVVSQIGFGCGGNAGLMVRGTAAEQERVIGRALDSGITYFDNAPDYGDGLAEENLGRVAFPTKFGTPQPIEAFGTLR